MNAVEERFEIPEYERNTKQKELRYNNSMKASDKTTITPGIRSINLKDAAIFKPGKSKNWTIKTPTQLKQKPYKWAWSNEY